MNENTHTRCAEQTSLRITQRAASDWNTRRMAEMGCRASSITPSANPASKAPDMQNNGGIPIELFLLVAQHHIAMYQILDFANINALVQS